MNKPNVITLHRRKDGKWLPSWEFERDTYYRFKAVNSGSVSLGGHIYRIHIDVPNGFRIWITDERYR